MGQPQPGQNDDSAVVVNGSDEWSDDRFRDGPPVCEVDDVPLEEELADPLTAKETISEVCLQLRRRQNSGRRRETEWRHVRTDL